MLLFTHFDMISSKASCMKYGVHHYQLVEVLNDVAAEITPYVLLILPVPLYMAFGIICCLSLIRKVSKSS
jgi:hypothetical protein